MKEKLKLIYKIETIICIAMLAITPMKPLLFKTMNTTNNIITEKVVEMDKSKLVYASTVCDNKVVTKLTNHMDIALYDNEINKPSILRNDVVFTKVSEEQITSEPETEEVATEVIEEETTIVEDVTEEIIEEETTTVEEVVEETTEEVIETNNGNYSEYEIYELAKIIMCEAEGESQKCKEYIGQVVMNRVKTYNSTIHDVIFQNNGRVYQFSPVIPGGRWYRVEPNQDCYDAAYTVLNASEPITDALYFESCSGPSWHSRNLTKVAEIDNTRFYVK